jgi:hypothetical protein
LFILISTFIDCGQKSPSSHSEFLLTWSRTNENFLP